MRFNISSDLIAQLAQMSKAEMSSDPVALIEGLYRFVQKTVGTDVMEKARYTFTKQIENFEDALALASKQIFEQTRIYPAITQAALAFQTSFAGITSQPGVLAQIGRLFRSIVSDLEQAVADFIGISPGLIRSLPMSQIEQIIETTFARMSPEEYQNRLETFINRLTDIFGDFREQAQVILSPIRQFAYSMFSDLGKAGAEILGQAAISVLKGFISDPLSLLQFAGTMAIASLPIAVGLRAGLGIFDRFIRMRATYESINDMISARMYQLGLKRDPLLEIERKTQQALAI